MNSPAIALISTGQTTRRRSAALILGILALTLPAALRAAEPAENSLRLTLPPVAYAVPGVETAIYFDNIILTEQPESYQFIVECSRGETEARRWVFLPTADDVGQHSLTVTIKEGDQTLGTAEMSLHVVSPTAGDGQDLRLLLIGDSLTHANVYPAELAKLLTQPGNPTWTLLGSHRPDAKQPLIGHEGYGGWTWERFVRRYDPQAPATGSGRSSPFVFLVEDKPQLDISRYLKEQAKDNPPQVVTFFLGINDCFGADPEDLKKQDAQIDAVFAQAETLLAAFRKAAPDADLGICLTPPPNSRESGFEANYKGNYHRWGWKRIQHRLVERQLKAFGGREKDRIFIIPTELYIDPVDGYPDNNGVHPNAVGYRQIAATLYAWTKWRLAERGAVKP